MKKENAFGGLTKIETEKQVKGSMSFFKAPIASYTDEQGKTVKASMTPAQELFLSEIFEMITADENLKEATKKVRNSTNINDCKKRYLPFFSPNGRFSYRRGDCLVEPSQLVIIDVDHLPSHEMAEAVRDRIFQDPWLQPALCFVSPSGLGVKALIPYERNQEVSIEEDITTHISWCMDYVSAIYGSEYVDTCGKDIARTSFLCHDENAKIRI